MFHLCEEFLCLFEPSFAGGQHISIKLWSLHANVQDDSHSFPLRLFLLKLVSEHAIFSVWLDLDKSNLSIAL